MPKHRYLLPDWKGLKGMRAALYCCETADQPSLETQENELRLVASQRGWEVAEVFKDHFLRGYDVRHGRDALCRGLKLSPPRFNIVMVWSIYCASNTLKDLVAFVNMISSFDHSLVVLCEGIDTTRSSDKGLLAAVAMLADFDRLKSQTRVSSRIALVRNRSGKIHNPRIDAKLRAMIEMDLSKGEIGQRKIAAKYCVGLGSVKKIRAENARGIHTYGDTLRNTASEEEFSAVKDGDPRRAGATGSSKDV